MKIEKKPSDNFQNYCITDPPNEKVENLINPVKLILTGPDSCDFSQPSRVRAASEARVERTAANMGPIFPDLYGFLSKIGA